MTIDPKSTTSPQFVGMKPSPDSVVSDYAEGVKRRREARIETSKEGKPRLPNLLRANDQYDPSKDKVMTLSDMADAQDVVDHVIQGGERPPSASPETIRGLQAIKEHSEKEHARMDAEAKEEAPAEAEAGGDEASKKNMTDDEVGDALGALDDMDLQLLMERVRSDIINNEFEREAIAKRVKPIDLAAGLASGEFTQLVPINDDLKVVYRTVSQMENDRMRRILFEWASDDARVANLGAERYGLMQTVCALVQIGGNKLPTHLEIDGNGTYKFLEDAFLKKYRLIASYPAPLIHVLGTHAFWFDQRVRKLFTSKIIKNG